MANPRPSGHVLGTALTLIMLFSPLISHPLFPVLLLPPATDQTATSNAGAADIFSDQGSWHAYGLPSAANVGGFTGPYIHTSWGVEGLGYLGQSLSRAVPSVNGQELAPLSSSSALYPGRLTHSITSSRTPRVSSCR